MKTKCHWPHYFSMFSARRGFMDPCRFLAASTGGFVCAQAKTCVWKCRVCKILVQRRCSKQRFWSTKSALSCLVQWPLHGATPCLICSAKLRFVSSFGMCHSHVDVSSALENIGVWLAEIVAWGSDTFAAGFVLYKSGLSHKDLCNMIRVARQMDAKLLLHEPCPQRLSAGSGKKFRQLRWCQKRRLPVGAGKLSRDLSENTRNFLSFARSCDAGFKLVLGELVKSLCAKLYINVLAWHGHRRSGRSTVNLRCLVPVTS